MAARFFIEAKAADRLPTIVPPETPMTQSLLYSPTLTPIRLKRLATTRTSEADGSRIKALPSATAAHIYGHLSPVGGIRTTDGPPSNATAANLSFGISTCFDGLLGGIALIIL